MKNSLNIPILSTCTKFDYDHFESSLNFLFILILFLHIPSFCLKAKFDNSDSTFTRFLENCEKDAARHNIWGSCAQSAATQLKTRV